MPAFLDEGIVLHAFDLGEADRIISLLTEKRGLLRGVAKGVRRTKSKFGARLEPFSRARILFHEGKNLHVITQAETVESHSEIRGDYHKFVCGEAILEMVEKSLQEGQHLPRFYPALCLTLKALGGADADPDLILAAFQLKTCALIGYHPHFDSCLHCGKPPGSRGGVFDLQGGGVACADCGGKVRHGFPLSHSALELSRRLLASEMNVLSRWKADPAVRREVVRASFRFAEFHLERPLRSARVVLARLES